MLRTRKFLINKIAELLGGRQECAKLAGVSESVMVAACTGGKRELNGKGLAGLFANVKLPAAQPYLYELAGHFAPPGGHYVSCNGEHIDKHRCPDCAALRAVGWVHVGATA
jgi:hypothetical protein